MTDSLLSRRRFLETAALSSAGLWLSSHQVQFHPLAPVSAMGTHPPTPAVPADYTLHIKTAPVEIAPQRILSTTTYKGQFPGPLFRFKEGGPATVDVFNDTDTPEQLHWYGLHVSSEVDGAAEEGTPFLAAHGMRRLSFTANPSGLRFYHAHNRAGADLARGQYSGQVGPVYIDPKDEPGHFDQEAFLVLKEFEPASAAVATWPWIFFLPPTA
jgi:hypothetical protein